jgi:hypothetical protein
VGASAAGNAGIVNGSGSVGAKNALHALLLVPAVFARTEKNEREMGGRGADGGGGVVCVRVTRERWAKK